MTMHTNFVKVATDHFHKPPSKIRARNDFHERRQHAGEMVHEFVTELRILAKDCAFGSMDKEMIATQLAVGCYNSDAKKQLLQKDNIDLDQYVTLVHSVEMSESEFSVLQTVGSLKILSAGAKSRYTGQSAKMHTQSSIANGGWQKHGASSGKSKNPKKEYAESTAKLRYMGCGNKGHKFWSDQCPQKKWFATNVGSVATSKHGACPRKRTRRILTKQKMSPKVARVTVGQSTKLVRTL